MSEIIPEHPKTSKAEIPVIGGEFPAIGLLCDELQKLVMALFGNDEQRPARLHFFVDRAHAMPAPGLNAFDHRVVENDGDVALIDVELGAAFRLEFLLREIV